MSRPFTSVFVLLCTYVITARCDVTDSATDDWSVTTDVTTDVAYTDWSNATEAEPSDATTPARVRRPRCPRTAMGRAAMNIKRNKDYVILAVGLLGNTMSLFVNARKMFKTSPNYYMAVLAIADTATILVWSVRLMHRLNTLSHEWGTPACKVVEFLSYFTRSFAVNTLVVMTIERTLVVLFPLRLSSRVSVKSAAVALGSVALFFFCFHAPLFAWAFEMEYRTIVQCVIDRTAWWATFDLVTAIYLPMVILLVCNVVIVCKMKSVADKQEELTNDSSKKSRARKQFVQITIQTLTVSFSFILLTVCITVWYFPGSPIYPTQYEAKYEAGSSMYCFHSHFAFLFKETAFMLYFANHAINGYLYCLFSRMFRQELAKNLCAIFCPGRLKKAKRTTPSGTAMTSMSSTNKQSVSTVS